MMRPIGPKLLALVATLSLAPSVRVAAADVSDGDAAALRKGAAAFAALERRDVEKLSAELDTLIADPDLASLFKARRRGELLASAVSHFEEMKSRGITHWYFLDPEPARTVFLRVHAPELQGDVVERDTLSQAIKTKKIGFGKEVGKTAFALRVVKPVRLNDQLVGYMELGEEIGQFLKVLKHDTGDDFGVLLDKRHLDRLELTTITSGEDRWDDQKEVVLVDSTMWNERTATLRVPLADLPDSGWMAGRWMDGGRAFVGAMFPLRDAAGRVAGVLFVRHAAG